jgi:cytochrome oxidase Cu insertion factor (SCO1/SenC/PrrC family)
VTFLSACKDNAAENPKRGMFSIEMPGITIYDFFGNTYTLNKDLKGRHILVYFIDADLENDLDSVEKSLRDFHDNGVIVSVAPRSIDKVIAKRYASSLYFVHGAYEKALNLFRAPQHQSVFYLFSDKGRFLHRGLIGTRYETHLKRILNFFIKNKKLSLSQSYVMGEAIHW